MDIPMESKRVPGWRRVAVGFDEMLTRAADGVFIMTADGRIAFWNRAAGRILGYSSCEVVGRRCCDFLHAWDERGRRLGCRGCHVIRLARKGAAVQTFDALVRHKAGRRLRIDISTLVAPDGGRAGDPLTVHLFHGATPPRDFPGHAGKPKPGPAPAASGPRVLTPRETEVVQLLTVGATSRAVAKRLNVSTATVRNHVQHILVKLGVHSRLEVVAYVLRHHLL